MTIFITNLKRNNMIKSVIICIAVLLVIGLAVGLALRAVVKQLEAYFGNKESKNPVNVNAKLIMPCGARVPADEELFQEDISWLDGLKKPDLFWLINYSGHKIEDTEGELKNQWRHLFVRLSTHKNQKQWWM